MEKYNLKNIIASAALSTGLMFGMGGCSSISGPNVGYNGKQPITLKEANFYKGPINKFVANYTNVESKRDAAAVDREKRCLENMVGKPFTSKNKIYNKMYSCVSEERRKDMIEYGIGSVLIDGLKVYLLLRGSTGRSSSSSTPTTPTTPTVGTGSSSGVIYSPIK